MNIPKKIILAGSTGTIGKKLLEKLDKNKYEIICPTRKNHEASPVPINSAVKDIYINLCHNNSIINFTQTYKDIDIIISCIGSRNGTLKEAKEVEFQANMNLLEIGKKLKVEQFILLSAICVQKRKLIFQKYKLKFEEELKRSGINYTIIRPTAFFKSLSGQINRVKKGKPFLLFDNGTNNYFKPISEKDLSLFIIEKIGSKNSYNSTCIVGGPGPAINPKQQGQILFKAANKPEKFRSIPTIIFKLVIMFLRPFSLFSSRIKDTIEYMNIAFFYATESLLVWMDHETGYSDFDTPEYGTDTLEEYYKNLVELNDNTFDTADRRLFK